MLSFDDVKEICSLISEMLETYHKVSVSPKNVYLVLVTLFNMPLISILKLLTSDSMQKMFDVETEQ